MANNKVVKVIWMSGKEVSIPADELRITSVGRDIIVFLGKKGCALDISETDRVTFSFLYRFLVHPWIYLKEYDTDYGCGDCDGYNYDNCDMDRCKNDCEHCGGRRYVCNDSCFFHRYATAVRICHNNDYQQAIDGVRPFVHMINMPLSRNWREVDEEHRSEISLIEKNCRNLYHTSGGIPDDAEVFLSECDLMHSLMKCRVDGSPTITLVLEKSGYTVKKTFFRRDAAARNTHGGFLWLRNTGTEVEFSGYNSVGDVIEEYTVWFTRSKQYPALTSAVSLQHVSRITAFWQQREGKYEVVSVERDA